jgi:hypothetical protein
VRARELAAKLLDAYVERYGIGDPRALLPVVVIHAHHVEVRLSDVVIWDDIDNNAGSNGGGDWGWDVRDELSFADGQIDEVVASIVGLLPPDAPPPAGDEGGRS